MIKFYAYRVGTRDKVVVRAEDLGESKPGIFVSRFWWEDQSFDAVCPVLPCHRRESVADYRELVDYTELMKRGLRICGQLGLPEGEIELVKDEADAA